MGIFSFLDKPFRTGRSEAERQQRRQAAAADERAQEAQEMSRELFELAKPSFELGQEQLAGFAEQSQQLSDPNVLGGLLTEIAESGLATGLERERMRGVEQYAASRGLRRSGAAFREAAKVPTDVLMGLLNSLTNRKLTGMQTAARIGTGQASAIQGGISGITTPATALGDAMFQEAGTKAGIIGSVLGGIGKFIGGGGGASGLASAFGSPIPSDSRIKENITKLGEFENGVGIYSYNYVGDGRLVIGVMAQELEEKIPNAVIEQHGFKHVNYEAIH